MAGNLTTLSPREVRWTDPVSGLPCLVLYYEREPYDIATFHALSPAYWIASVGFVPGHPLYERQDAPDVLLKVIKPVQNSIFITHACKLHNGLIWWVGSAFNRYETAYRYAMKLVSSIPEDFWMPNVAE